MIRVLHTLPDLALGGGQLLLLRNLSAMNRGEFEHLVCSLAPLGGKNGMDAQYAAAGVAVASLNIRSAKEGPAGLWRLVRMIRRFRPDIVHTNNTGTDRLLGQTAALLTGVPVVNSVHSEYHLGRARPGLRNLPRKARLVVDRAVARRTVRHIVAVSGLVKTAWAPHFRALGVPDDHVSVVHPAVETGRRPPLDAEGRAALRRSLGLPQGTPLLINVARPTAGKGHHWLIGMMPALAQKRPGAHLVLVGDGELRGALQEQAEREGAGDLVTFLGRRDDVPDLLAAADLFVFPSVSEGFGIALLEAMAAGLPCVAFRLPAYEEFAGGAAELVENGDAGSFARAVDGLLSDPARAERMRAEARALAGSFDQRTASARLGEIYRTVLGAAAEAPDAVRASSVP